LIGRKCYEAYQRRETPCPWCPSLKTLSTGETCVEEAPFKQKDGSTRWLEVSSYPLKDNNGNINSVIEHIKNITERKNDEANLRRSRDMLTRTEQIAHIGSWEWFIETDTVTWSEELFRIFKIPPGSKAPSGAEQHKLYHPEDFEKLRQTIKKAISCGDPYEIKLRAIRTDGETRICLARGFPEIDEHGNVIRLYGSLQDITELIKADLAFRENEEYLRTVINATRDGFWIINSRGILEHVNQAYLDMTGYSRDEFLGMHINDIDAIEDPETSRKRMEYIISNGHDLFETKHRRKDGSTFFVEIATTYLDIAGGKFVCFARDITERKHMEDELRESKERLSLALDASMNGYWDWNLENDDIYVSPQYYTMLGYEPGDLSTRRESWMDIMHPEDQEHVLPEILYNISSGEPYSTEFRLRCRDGSWKWISSQGKSYEFTSEGIPTRAVGVYSDIDQQKRAELENIKLTRRINAGLRMGNLAWWEMRLPSGKVIFDERKTEMLGYSPDEFIHYSDFTNLIHPDDYEKAMQAVRDHMDGSADIYDVEYRIQTADGSYRWFHDVGGITERNTETGETLLVGIVQDITEQKRQQEHLQIRNLAIENSLAGIAIADLDYTITYVNPSTLTIWGIDDVNEVIGNSIFDFWEDKETARKDMQDVLSGEKLATERAAFRKDGTKRIIALSASLVTGDKDEPLGIVGTFQDITEKKAAEEGLQAAFEQKQELLRELQHRAKNSFNTIESLMRLKADTLSNMEAKEIISELRSRVRALSELYTMLYDTDSPGTINLGNYCARVAMFSEEMGEHVTINKTMDRVQSNTKDAATVGLIVTELITNAIKHAFPDGRKGTITCSLKKKNEGAVLTVADDGVGIPEDFDLNNTSTMGLMLVQSLVKQLGGVMEIERDSGTRFTVTLPEVV
ncbi:MAG: PAS domain S-box protein, partial [Spirochaetota bacterium]